MSENMKSIFLILIVSAFGCVAAIWLWQEGRLISPIMIGILTISFAMRKMLALERV